MHVDLAPAAGHALRRTAATLSLQAGMSLRDVQAMLGHASPLMTMTRYALPDVDAQRVGSNRVAETILGSMSIRPLILCRMRTTPQRTAANPRIRWAR